MDTSDLNTPSIAIGDIPGSQTVRRRVTNVSGNPQTFTASVTGMDGFAVVVNPARFTLGAGVTREFSVNFTRTTAPVYASKPDLYAAFRAGQLTWSNGLTAVRIPMIVQAIADTATAPPLVQGSGGFMRYPMNVGYTGPFSVTTRGLVPSIEHSNAIATGGVATFRVTIPVDTIYASFSMFDSDVPAGSDFAIAVKAPGGAPIRSSERVVGSREEVNLIAPPPGVYTLEVRAVSVPGVAPFKAHSFILGETSANNLAAYAPFMVTAGQSIKISLVPIPYLLPYGKRYMGAIVYGGNAGLPDPTLVRIDR